MHILHVIHSIAVKRGGPTFALREMTKEAIARGHQCTIVSTDFDLDTDPPHGFEKSIEIIMFKSLDPKQYPFSITMAAWLFKNVRRFDLVHVHTFFTFPALSAAFCSSFRGIPFLIRPLGTLDPWSLEQKSTKKRLFLRTVGQSVLNRATGVHVTSNQEEINLRAFGEHLHLFNVPLGVKLPEVNEGRARKEGPLRLLYLSRIHPKKNVPTLVEAVNKLIEAGHDLELVLAGGGEEKHIQPIRDLIDSLTHQKITLAGFKEGAQKVKLLEECDVFVLPSFQENFGIAVAEGMAYGKPVLISDVIALSKDVDIAKAGLTFPPEDVERLMSCIVEMSSSQLRQECGRNGRRLVTEKYSLEGLGQRLEDMYQQVLSKQQKINNFLGLTYRP